MENTPNPRVALTLTRIIWGALFLGPLVFFFVVLGILLQPVQPPPPEPSLGRILFLVNIGMLVVMVPLGYILRAVQYRQRTPDGAVKPAAYSQGNIMLFAMVEGQMFFSLVVTLVTRSLWPAVLPAAIGAVIHLVNFPRGEALEPRAGRPEDILRPG